MSSTMSRWIPALRKVAIGTVIAFLLFGAIGYFAIPQLVRWGVETVASRELGRPVKVESVGANPYTLSITLSGLVIDGAPGDTAPLLHALKSAGRTSDESLYVGDDLRDVQAGRAAGLGTVAAAYGYLGEADPIEQWGADHIIHAPDELLRLIRQ
jgi:phosphoglycolate phosphatase